MKMQIREILMRPISEVLRARKPVQCSPETTVADAVTQMRTDKVGSLLVTEGLKVLGIFTERDFLEKIALTDQDPFKTPITEVMTPGPVCMARTDSIGKVLQRMRDGRFRHIIIVDAYQNLENIVSIRQITDYTLSAAGQIIQLDQFDDKKAA